MFGINVHRLHMLFMVLSLAVETSGGLGQEKKSSYLCDF